MTVNRTGGAAAPARAQSTEQFNPSQYLDQQLTEGQSATFVKAMGDSYSASFDRNVRQAVSALGPNATQQQVDQAISKETTAQLVAKSVMDMAQKSIMNKIKEISSDTFTAE
jgi:hypothetical protein